MRRHIPSALLGAVAVLLAFPFRASAQEYPLLESAHVNLITQEVSGDAAYEHVRFMTQFHRPRGGSDGLWRVAEYFAEQARASGLADVKTIKQASTGRPWNARFADLWTVGDAPERIASTLQSPLHLADFSRPANVTAELVDIGAGEPREYEGQEIAGKIVLTYAPLQQALREAVIRRGAAGIIWYPNPFSGPNGIDGSGVSRPDQIRWLTLPAGQVDGKEPTFAFVLSTREGIDLRNRLREAATPLRVHATVDAAFTSGQGAEPWQVMVEAFIPGSDPASGQDIVMTGHLQEESFSANDDASGSGSTLEVARALNRLIEEGRIPRPRRNLRFWWVTEISSERQYFADNPNAHESIWVGINQDMVGADQAQDIMRKQNVTRLPGTRFHFFNDVVESAVEYMVRTNTFELAQLQNGIPLYPKAHLAKHGSMHRFNAEVIPFHNNSDHMTFLEAPIAIPATSFTNMPDRFIHSSDDDLWNVDRTQLGRNAAAVALIAYTMASADEAAVGRLTAETVGRGAERIGRNLRLGISWIAAAREGATAYHHATDQIRYAVERERLALRSLTEIHASAARITPALLSELDRRETQALREVELAQRHATGQAPPRRTLSATEEQLTRLRPVLTGGPREFLEGRGRIAGVPALHDLMRFEVLNAVDGRRNGFEIYSYVAAEAREGGAHYYGTVRPEDVLQYLQNVEAAGLMRLDGRAVTAAADEEVN